MTINDPDAYLKGVWDWGILDGCFGTGKIRPTDIDGFVEHRGHFLVLEAKGPGADIPRGQERTIEALRETGLFTIIVVWGEKDSPRRLLVLTKNSEYLYERADLQTFRNVVQWWYDGVHNRRN